MYIKVVDRRYIISNLHSILAQHFTDTFLMEARVLKKMQVKLRGLLTD